MVDLFKISDGQVPQLSLACIGKIKGLSGPRRPDPFIGSALQHSQVITSLPQFNLKLSFGISSSERVRYPAHTAWNSRQSLGIEKKSQEYIGKRFAIKKYLTFHGAHPELQVGGHGKNAGG